MGKLDYRFLYANEGKGTHRHDYAQILLPLRMVLTLEYCGHVYSVQPSELGFIPPDTLHQCLCDSDLIVINIPSEMIRPGDLELLGANFILPIEGSLVPLVELIRAEVERNSRAIRHLFYYLYERLVENNSFLSVRYIRENFDQPISVNQLAELEGYNPTYFNEWFKSKTGLTPANYIRHYRIEKAKELLLTTDYKILEIAAQVGYNGHAAFTRAFKEDCGVSPAEYRKSGGDV